MVGEDIDPALADDQCRVLRQCTRIPHAFLSAFAEAPEAVVTDLEATDTVAVAVRKDGVTEAVVINPPGKAWIVLRGTGDTALVP
jgi:hypothetical protein